MPSSLEEIKKPVKGELIEFEKYFKDAMKSNVSLLEKITYYIVQHKGKQIRPLFVFLCAKLCGKISDSTYVAASLIELLHTATLVHDDVVDDAEERRGFHSIYALWKTKIAVLVGDYLLSKGLLMALDNDHFGHLKIVSTAVREMSEGELLQIEKARRLDIKEEVYYEIIKGKTASLIAASCASGAASTTKDETIIDNMRQFGENIGMAFQIKDDLFDYGEQDIGKPRGIDIQEKKMTLPLIYALNNASRGEKRKYINYIKRDSKNKKKVKEIIEFVRKSGGLDYAMDKMNHYQNKAFEILKKFPDSPSKKSLENLVAFVTQRKK